MNRAIRGAREASGVQQRVPPKEVRRPLPKGPFLVVGLARSGQAAARMLAGRGEAARAVDSGHPEGAAGLEGVGVEVFLDTDGVAQLEGTRTVVKSPGVPREASVIAAALERGIEVMGEVELAWRLTRATTEGMARELTPVLEAQRAAAAATAGEVVGELQR